MVIHDVSFYVWLLIISIRDTMAVATAPPYSTVTSSRKNHAG